MYQKKATSQTHKNTLRCELKIIDCCLFPCEEKGCVVTMSDNDHHSIVSSTTSLSGLITRTIADNATDVLGTNLAQFYLGGVAVSVVFHSVLRAVRSHTEFVRERELKRGRGAGNDDDIEPEITATLHGAGWGFLTGVWRGWIWPVHVVAGTFVLGAKKVRERRCRALEEEGKKAN